MGAGTCSSPILASLAGAHNSLVPPASVHVKGGRIHIATHISRVHSIDSTQLGTSYAQFVEHILATKVATPTLLDFSNVDGYANVPFPEGDTLDFERYL